MLFVPLKLAPRERKDLNLFDKTKFDSIWVECRNDFSKNCKKTMLINVTYNPMKQFQNDFLEQLETNIDNSTCETANITMMGDYNLDYLTPLERENLETVILPYGFSVASPNLPTRVCKTTKTHIDYIIAENILDGKCFVFNSPFKTDHFGSVVFTNVFAEKQKCTILQKFDLSTYQKDAFCLSLSNIPWFRIYNCSNATDMFNLFVYMLASVVEKHAPVKKIFLRKRTPKLFKESWYDSECKTLTQARQAAYHEYCNNTSAQTWSTYSKLRNQLSKVLKEKQEKFAWSCFSSLCTAKERWNFINTARGQNKKSVNLAAVRNSFGKMIVDDKEMADHFNLIFSNLGQYFGNINDEVPSFLPGDSSFSFSPITVKDCYDIINELKPNKPTGPCKVPAWAIIDGKQILTSHLTFILNECIYESVFPTMLKRATITPIFKKDDILDPKNYRPISITTTFSKILEKCIHRQITAYIEEKNLLAPLQFGFRKKVSVEDAVLFFTESVQQEIQDGKIVHAVLLDLSKAFDSLSHEILLSKLKSLGFSFSAINFINSFLSDRMQQVSLNGVKSDWIELKQGVPEGTILGPLLFNLYVNDLTGQITEDARIIQYADDCLLFCSHQDPDIALQCLQTNILKLESYFKSHRLNLNGSKTEFITFSRKKKTRDS